MELIRMRITTDPIRGTQYFSGSQAFYINIIYLYRHPNKVILYTEYVKELDKKEVDMKWGMDGNNPETSSFSELG